jgi:hypothetical protein
MLAGLNYLVDSSEPPRNNECVGRHRGVLLVGYCLPLVPIDVDTWRLDLPSLSGTFLSFDIRAKPVWSPLSSLQSSETNKLRDRSRAEPLNHFLKSRAVSTGRCNTI